MRGSQAGRVPDKRELKEFSEDIVCNLGCVKDAGIRGCSPAGLLFCPAASTFYRALGWGRAGEAMLPAICRRNTTNTHTRANGNSQQNKQCQCRGCPARRVRQVGRPWEARGHLLVLACGWLAAPGRARLPHAALPGESLSFSQLPGLKSQGL